MPSHLRRPTATLVYRGSPMNFPQKRGAAMGGSPRAKFDQPTITFALRVEHRSKICSSGGGRRALGYGLRSCLPGLDRDQSDYAILRLEYWAA